MVSALILWVASTGWLSPSGAFQERLFEEAAWSALPTYASDTTDRRYLFLALYHLQAWDHLHRLLSLSPPRRLLDSLLWMETQVHRDSLCTLLPMIEALEQRHPSLGPWVRYRRAQVALTCSRDIPLDPLYRTLMPPFRTFFLRMWADSLIAREDTAQLRRLLPELQKYSPVRALFARGLLDLANRARWWRTLILEHPGHPLARTVARRFRPGREERAALALAQGQYREVLRWTRSLRTARLWWYRMDALYRLQRYRAQLQLYHRYPALLHRNPDPRWMFRALVAAYRLQDIREFHGFLGQVLEQGTRRQQEEAAHLLGEWLLQLDPSTYRREQARVVRQVQQPQWVPDVAFWAGLALITRGDTALGVQWLRLALLRSQPGFFQDQVRYWLSRVEGAPVEVDRPLSFYRWIQPVAFRILSSPPPDPDPAATARTDSLLLWSVRLHLPWLRALLRAAPPPPEIRIQLAMEARRWGWDDLPLLLLRPLSRDTAWAEKLWPLLYPTPYRPWVCEASRSTGIPVALLYAIMREESHFRPRAVSPVGARGLLQLMPGTARRYGVQDPEDLFRPQVNIATAARLLADLSDSLPHRFAVVAAYNAGRKAVQRWLALPVQDSVLWVEWIGYRETRNYVRRVIRSARVYRNLLSATFCEERDAP